MSELKSEYRFGLTASVTQLLDIGGMPSGNRHVDLLGSGTFERQHLREVETGRGRASHGTTHVGQDVQDEV